MAQLSSPPVAVWMISIGLVLFLAGALGEKDPRRTILFEEKFVEGLLDAGFRQQLVERTLQDSIPVLQDSGVTNLRIFSMLEEEDFSAMNIKLGHRRVMVDWWRSLHNHHNKGTGGQKNKDTMKTRSHEFGGYPSSHATTRDWGKQEFTHCVQPYSWREIIHGYKDMNVSTLFKMGSLGKLLEANGYETWQCLRDHYCATEADDSWFCFVYHEQHQVFTPWGKNSQLKLVPVQLTGARVQTECQPEIMFINTTVQVPVEIEKIVYVNRTELMEVPVEIEKIVYVNKTIEVPVRVVENVTVQTEKIVIVNQTIEVFVDKSNNQLGAPCESRDISLQDEVQVGVNQMEPFYFTESVNEWHLRDGVLDLGNGAQMAVNGPVSFEVFLWGGGGNGAGICSKRWNSDWSCEGHYPEYRPGASGGSGGISAYNLTIGDVDLGPEILTIQFKVGGSGQASEIISKRGYRIGSEIAYATPITLVVAGAGAHATPGTYTNRDCSVSSPGAGGSGNLQNGASGSRNPFHVAKSVWKGMHAGDGGQGHNFGGLGFDTYSRNGGQGLIVVHQRVNEEVYATSDNSKVFESMFPMVLDSAGRSTWTVQDGVLSFQHQDNDFKVLPVNVSGFRMNLLNLTVKMWGAGGAGAQGCTSNSGLCNSCEATIYPGPGGGSGGYTEQTIIIPVATAKYRRLYHFDVGRGSSGHGGDSQVTMARSAWIGERYVNEPEQILIWAGGGKMGTADTKYQYVGYSCSSYSTSYHHACRQGGGSSRQSPKTAGIAGVGNTQNGLEGALDLRGGQPVKRNSYQGGKGGDGAVSVSSSGDSAATSTSGDDGLIVLELNSYQLWE